MGNGRDSAVGDSTVAPKQAQHSTSPAGGGIAGKQTLASGPDGNESTSAPGTRTAAPVEPAAATVGPLATGRPGWEYVEHFRAQVLAALTTRVIKTGLVEPHPRLRWTAPFAASIAVGNAVREFVDAVPGLTLKRIMELTPPADLVALVDAVRNGDASGGWLPAVGVALSEALDVPIAVSIQRMGARLRVQLDEHGREMPHASELVASCPLDGVIAEVLVQPERVTNTAAVGAKDTPGKPFAHGARDVVNFKWLGEKDPNLWNVIHVLSPANATAEDVARMALDGDAADDSEQAYRIAASPPYFTIPIETARKVQAAWNYAPASVQRAYATNVGPRLADPMALASSTTSDEAALAQTVDAPGPGALSATHALERSRVQLASMREKLAPWHAASPLAAAAHFLDRRASDGAASPKWTAVLVAQEQVLHDASSDVAAIMQDLESHGAKPSDAAALGPVVSVLEAYARAAGVSHLPAQAKGALAEARRTRAMLPVAIAEDRIRVARELVAEQQGEQRRTNLVVDRSEETIGAVPGLASRAADLRLGATRTGAVDVDGADQLAVDAEETALRAEISTFQTRLLALEHEADEAGLNADNGAGYTLQMTAAAFRNDAKMWLKELDLHHGLNTRFGAANNLGTPRQRIIHAREDIVSVQKQFGTFGQKNEILEWFKWADKRIANQRIHNMLVSMAAQIGIMLVTGEIAGAGVAAVRGLAMAREAVMLGDVVADLREAKAAYTVLEVTSQTFMATKAQGLVGGETGARAFSENLLAISLAGVAMKPFAALKGDTAAIEQQLRTWSGFAKATAKSAAYSAIEVGVSIGASGMAQALTNDGRVSTAGADDVVTQGISVAIGAMVHGHSGEIRTRVERAVGNSEEARGLMRRLDDLERRARAAGDAPSIPEARVILRDFNQALRDESALYVNRRSDDRARAANDADRAALSGDFVDAPFRLAGLRPVVDGEVYEGTNAQIRDGLSLAEQSGASLRSSLDPNTGVWTATNGDRTFRLRDTTHDAARRWTGHLETQLDAPSRARYDERTRGQTSEQVMESWQGHIDSATDELDSRSQPPPDTATRFTVGELPPWGAARWAYLDAPAHWQPERAALHVQLLAKARAQAAAFAEQFVGKEPTLYAMRGNTAAGKTRAVSGNVPELAAPMQATKALPHRSINPDNFKADLIAATPGATSSDVHSESSMLCGRLEQEVLSMRAADGHAATMLIDKRLATVADVQSYAALAKASGRRFVMFDVDAPLADSLVGVLDRVPGGSDPLPPFEVVDLGYQAIRGEREEVGNLFKAPGFGTYHLYGTRPNGIRVEIMTIADGHTLVQDGDLYHQALSPTEALATTRITADAIDSLTSQLSPERAAKIRSVLSRYEGWTWKSALDAHSQERNNQR
ncbi:MAG TPA: hypothetical protein VGM90_16370 [Kofleriaceae bacterium]|jgi:hypothetical protein